MEGVDGVVENFLPGRVGALEKKSCEVQTNLTLDPTTSSYTRAMARSAIKSKCKTVRLPKGKQGTHRCAPRRCAAHLTAGVRTKLMAALDNSEPGTSTGVKRKYGDNNDLRSMIQSILADSNSNDDNDNGDDMPRSALKSNFKSAKLPRGEQRSVPMHDHCQLIAPRSSCMTTPVGTHSTWVPMSPHYLSSTSYQCCITSVLVGKLYELRKAVGLTNAPHAPSPTQPDDPPRTPAFPQDGAPLTGIEINGNH